MLLRRLLGFSALHFVVWAIASIVAYGSDLDQVPQRSALAGASASAATLLQSPHDWLLRVLPSNLLQQYPQAAAVLVVANSLLWGIGLVIAWHLLSATRAKSGGSTSPLSRFS